MDDAPSNAKMLHDALYVLLPCFLIFLGAYMLLWFGFFRPIVHVLFAATRVGVNALGRQDTRNYLDGRYHDDSSLPEWKRDFMEAAPRVYERIEPRLFSERPLTKHEFRRH